MAKKKKKNDPVFPMWRAKFESAAHQSIPPSSSAESDPKSSHFHQPTRLKLYLNDNNNSGKCLKLEQKSPVRSVKKKIEWNETSEMVF